MKRTIVFVIAYFIISMGWAYPWHMVWFHALYAEWGAFQRTEPLIMLGMLATLIQGAVIAYLYPFYLQGKESTLVRGISFSLIIGLMVYSVMGFATAAKFMIEPVAPFLALHTVFQVIQFTLTGVALGFIFKKL